MYQDLIVQILETVLVPLLIALTGFFVKWLNAKSNSLKEQTNNETLQKYIDMLNTTVTDCVTATTQTYVSSLKQENAFTKEAQQEAFNKSYTAIMEVLSEEAKEYLTEAYGDLSTYITNLIEAEVNRAKS
jgi:hypothetical protein